MLLVKMIRIALILKDLDLTQFFKDKESIDIQGLVNHLELIDKNIVIQIAKTATDDKSIDNELDAVLALTAFFLKLIQQAKTSKYLKEILSLTSLQNLVENQTVEVK